MTPKVSKISLHTATMVEVAGNIVEQSVSILIDPGSTNSYITPRVVDI